MNRATAEPSYGKLVLGTKLYARKSNRCSLAKNKLSAIEVPALEVVPATESPDSYFIVMSWSPDGQKLAGTRLQPAGPRGLFVYTFGSSSYHKLAEAAGYPVWLRDSRRLLFADGGRLLLADSQTGKAREIFPHIASALAHSIWRRRTLLCLLHRTTEPSISLCRARKPTCGWRAGNDNQTNRFRWRNRKMRVLLTSQNRSRAVTASAFEFISENRQIASVREFMRALPGILRF